MILYFDFLFLATHVIEDCQCSVPFDTNCSKLNQTIRTRQLLVKLHWIAVRDVGLVWCNDDITDNLR